MYISITASLRVYGCWDAITADVKGAHRRNLPDLLRRLRSRRCLHSSTRTDPHRPASEESSKIRILCTLSPLHALSRQSCKKRRIGRQSLKGLVELCHLCSQIWVLDNFICTSTNFTCILTACSIFTRGTDRLGRTPSRCRADTRCTVGAAGSGSSGATGTCLRRRIK